MLSRVYGVDMRALQAAAVAILLLVAPVAAAAGPGPVSEPADATPPGGVSSPASETSPLSAGGQSSVAFGPDTAERVGPTERASPPPASVAASTIRSGAPQVDGDDRTLRTLSTPVDVAVRTGSYEQSADLGSSLGFATADADAGVETAAVVERVERAETSAERQQRIRAAIDRVERQEERLNDRQADAFDAHASGDLTDAELVDELVRVAAAARGYDERLDELNALAEATDGFSSPGRLDELQVALQVYEGPVRDHALSTARAESPTNGVYVASSANAVVLAAMVDGEYVREAFRVDRWDRGGQTISNDEAIGAVKTAYPETAALREPDAFGAGAVQRVTVPHEFGTLRVFVGGGRERVFAEHQRIDLAAFPDSEPVTAAGDGLDVTVDRTYPGGPVTVTVLDEETGQPVPGVTVTKAAADGDSRAVGTTDRNGVVRTLSPAEPYRITVIDEPSVVVLDGIEPLRTPRPVDPE